MNSIRLVRLARAGNGALVRERLIVCGALCAVFNVTGRDWGYSETVNIIKPPS